MTSDTVTKAGFYFLKAPNQTIWIESLRKDEAMTEGNLRSSASLDIPLLLALHELVEQAKTLARLEGAESISALIDKYRSQGS